MMIQYDAIFYCLNDILIRLTVDNNVGFSRKFVVTLNYRIFYRISYMAENQTILKKQYSMTMIVSHNEYEQSCNVVLEGYVTFMSHCCTLISGVTPDTSNEELIKVNHK